MITLKIYQKYLQNCLDIPNILANFATGTKVPLNANKI